MKALRFHSPGGLRLEEVHDSVCGPAQVNMRVPNTRRLGLADVLTAFDIVAAGEAIKVTVEP